MECGGMAIKKHKRMHVSLPECQKLKCSIQAGLEVQAAP